MGWAGCPRVSYKAHTPYLNDFLISSENQIEPCKNHSESSLAADGPLVHVSQASVTCTTGSVDSEGRSVSTVVENSSSRYPSSQPSRMAFVRRRLQKSGLSKEAIDLNIKGVRNSTSIVYDNHWKRWCMWCEDHQIDPGNPSSIDIANHLAFMSRS